MEKAERTSSKSFCKSKNHFCSNRCRRTKLRNVSIDVQSNVFFGENWKDRVFNGKKNELNFAWRRQNYTKSELKIEWVRNWDELFYSAEFRLMNKNSFSGFFSTVSEFIRIRLNFGKQIRLNLDGRKWKD